MKKLKESRFAGFLIVLLVYIIASAAGILSSIYIPIEHMVLNIFVADTIATIVVFIFSCIFKNSSLYDPYWSVQPIVIIGALLFKYQITWLSILFIIAIALWGIRLTVNWIYTFQNLNWQDWRYTMLEQKTKAFYPVVNFFGIHYFPTVVVFLLIAPVIHVLSLNGLTLNAFTFVGLGVSIIAIALETISDIQMHIYRKNRTTPFIRLGLWKYSRHPNYLGEILFWWGIAIMAFSVTQNFLYFIGALVNTLMFLFISIPMADKRQSRKAGFEQYKKETFMLLPFKKLIIKK